MRENVNAVLLNDNLQLPITTAMVDQSNSIRNRLRLYITLAHGYRASNQHTTHPDTS